MCTWPVKPARNGFFAVGGGDEPLLIKKHEEEVAFSAQTRGKRMRGLQATVPLEGAPRGGVFSI